MNRHTHTFLFTGLLLTGLAAGPAVADTTVEYADVVGQGPAGPLVAMDGARLVRSDNKLIISVRIPTPSPGSYNYPGANPFNAAAVEGSPEAFSLWGFVFNDPASCVGGGPGVCTPADAKNGTGDSAAFNVAGHLVAGPVLQLNGSITFNTEPFLNIGVPLMYPHDAEVHLAIAPHGAVQPEYLPNQIKTPIGSPDFWWVALFQP